jgi:hypothetical protein
MIYLEDYDLSVIALNINMFVAGLLFIFTNLFSQIIEYTAVGDADVFGFGAALLTVLAGILLAIMISITVVIDVWWYFRKTDDNRRWL